MIEKGDIKKYEFDKFTISNSWIKNLLCEFKIWFLILLLSIVLLLLFISTNDANQSDLKS